MLLSKKVQRDLDIGAKYNRGKTCGTVQNFTHSNRHSNCWNLDCCSGAGKIQQSNRLDTKFHLQYYQSPEVKRTLDKMTKSAMKKKKETRKQVLLYACASTLYKTQLQKFKLLQMWATQRFTKVNIFSTKSGTQIRISQGCNGRVATSDFLFHV